MRLKAGRTLDPSVLDRLDALVLNGGEDVATSLWREGETGQGAERDRFELALLRIADARRLPVLGICRGAQLLNVQRGGSLVDDVAARRPAGWKRRVLRPALRVEVRTPSNLAQLVGGGPLRVNCLHHQAVRATGADLSVSAHDQFGIVQAIEGPGPRFVLGVQWHPELLPFARSSRRLFQAVVRAARRHVAARKADMDDYAMCTTSTPGFNGPPE